MRKIAILLSLLTAYVAAEESSCWSEPSYHWYLYIIIINIYKYI